MRSGRMTSRVVVLVLLLAASVALTTSPATRLLVAAGTVGQRTPSVAHSGHAAVISVARTTERFTSRRPEPVSAAVAAALRIALLAAAGLVVAGAAPWAGTPGGPGRVSRAPPSPAI